MKTFCFLLSIILLTTFYGCKKTSPAPPNYIITNKVGKHVTVNIYATFFDYYSANAPFKTLSIDANSTSNIPLSDFDTTHTYYIDWYSDDFWFSNWGTAIGIDTNSLAIKPRQISNQYQVVAYKSGWQRRLCLNGNNTTTTWKAYDAYNYSYTSIWASLSAYEQYRQLLLRKDLTASYIHKDATGTLINDSITYYFINPNTPDMVMAQVNGSSKIAHFDNRSSVAVTTTPLSKDTIAVAFSDGYFMMARQ